MCTAWVPQECVGKPGPSRLESFGFSKALWCLQSGLFSLQSWAVLILLKGLTHNKQFLEKLCLCICVINYFTDLNWLGAKVLS